MDLQAIRRYTTLIMDHAHELEESLDPESELADDEWSFRHWPFLNDLALTALVGIHHQVERELVFIAARTRDNGAPITGRQHRRRVLEERKVYKRKRDDFIARLGLRRTPFWGAMETLRLLSNAYKHEPFFSPDAKLLKQLRQVVRRGGEKIPPLRDYDTLDASDALRRALARSLRLPADTPYWTLTSEFTDRAERFLAATRRRLAGRMSRVRMGPVSVSHFVG